MGELPKKVAKRPGVLKVADECQPYYAGVWISDIFYIGWLASPREKCLLPEQRVFKLAHLPNALLRILFVSLPGCFLLTTLHLSTFFARTAAIGIEPCGTAYLQALTASAIYGLDDKLTLAPLRCF